MSALTAKQRSFAHNYSASHNATRAAAAAGYAETRARRTGSELLHNPAVSRLIEKLDQKKRDAAGIDEPWIVGHLKEIVERTMAGRPRTNGLGELILDARTGEPIIDNDYTNANRALQTLSKIAGLQVKRVEAHVEQEWVFTLNLPEIGSQRADYDEEAD